ncbi:MAG: hypothetical protein H7Z12_17625 [Rhodospirillaceae bacterium]|nr:hypothetical protein [Rhodospirillales bacterium]
MVEIAEAMIRTPPGRTCHRRRCSSPMTRPWQR